MKLLNKKSMAYKTLMTILLVIAMLIFFIFLVRMFRGHMLEGIKNFFNIFR